MLHPGLVSITFRQLSPAQIIELAAECGLVGIEWGGDVHVPPGDVETANRVARETKEAGLRVAAYGSYYRLAEAPPFAPVLASADALEAPLIRVWAGNKASADATDEDRRRVADDARRVGELAHAVDRQIVLEWHGGTLTDTTESAVALLEAIDHPAVRTYWQPRVAEPFEECLADLRAALPYVAGAHVFQWGQSHLDRRPLAEGEEVWRAYLGEIIDAVGEGDAFALLEFVREDDPAHLPADAATLRDWLAHAQTGPRR